MTETNAQIKDHHFAGGKDHPLKGVALTKASKRTYNYGNPTMSSAQEAVFGQLMCAHENEIYRVDHEPRQALSIDTKEARLPVHKAALRVYEHMLAMDDFGDTIPNVARSQECIRRHVDCVFDILKHRGFIELAETPDRDALGRFLRSSSSGAEAKSQMIRLTKKGRMTCEEVVAANERQKDDRYHRRKEIQKANAAATNRRRRRPRALQSI